MNRQPLRLGRFLRIASRLRWTLALLGVVGAAFDARADPDLPAVIANVRANEAVYTDVDVSYDLVYTLNVDPAVAAKASGSNFILSSKTRRRSVNQSGLFRFESDKQVTMPGGKTESKKFVRAYDGQTTRVRSGNVANVHHGRSDEPDIFRPHTFLLARADVSVPLSLWLQGGKELSAHKYAGSYREYAQHTFVESEEQIDGLDCVKLRCETRDGTGVNTLRYVWLAPNRNYLPVKTVGYIPAYSKTLPIEVGTCSDFRELKPGIWLPFKCALTIYDEIEAREGKQAVSNREEWSIQRAELDPKHDISFFQQVEIPKGTVVYELVNDEIISSKVEGRESKAPGPSRSASRIVWKVALVLAVIFVVVSLLYLRKRKSAVA